MLFSTHQLIQQQILLSVHHPKQISYKDGLHFLGTVHVVHLLIINQFNGTQKFRLTLPTNTT